MVTCKDIACCILYKGILDIKFCGLKYAGVMQRLAHGSVME